MAKARERKVRSCLAALALALAACGANPAADVSEDLLSRYDLTDQLVAAEVLAGLPKPDRALFQTYLLHHYALSEAYCGDALLDSEGREPRTVGDAIALTRIREAQLAAAQEATPPASLAAARASEIEGLIERRSLLFDQLAVEDMLAYENTAERKRTLSAQIDDVDAALADYGVDPADR
jgi:hypothetical protein